MGNKDKNTSSAHKASVKKKISKLEDNFFQQISDAVPAMVVVYNINTGEYLYVNESVKKILGYSPKDFIKKGYRFVASLVHPQDLQRVISENEKALEKANDKKFAKRMNRSIIAFEYRMKHKNGKYRWLKTDGIVFSRDSNGNVENVLNASIDITRRKEAEEKLSRFNEELEVRVAERTKRLREHEKQLLYYASLSQSVPDAVISTDMKFNIQSFNKGAEDMYGWEEKDVLGKKASKIVPTEYPYNQRGDVLDSITGEGKWNGEVIQTTKGGQKLNILASVSSVTNSDDKQIGSVAVNRDITQRKALESQKDEFIAIVSHELKTPVTSLKAYTQFLQQKFAKAKDLKSVILLAKMDAQINKLTVLIKDLLDVTKIEGGKLQFNEDFFYFDELVDEVIEETQRTTNRHKIIKEGKAGKTITGDRDRIGQVITNLIGNAIKYSPKTDRIIVKTALERDGIVLSVKDFGVGIPKAEQKGLFERFHRVNAPTHSTVPGMGLGLYISSEIIKRQGGDIWFESTFKKGSTFFFKIPLGKSRLVESKAPTYEEMRNGR